MKELTNYTHTNVKITDIRLKRSKEKGSSKDFFAIKVDDVESTMFVNFNIFNDRIKSFFLGKSVNEIERYQLLDLKWNFIITEGYYLKIIEKDHFEKVYGVPNKFYVSVLEIAGPIGNFENNFSSRVRIYDDAITDRLYSGND
jgi:hypothetical protein